jgi:hypothetical protein
MYGVLLHQRGGNQCGLILDSYSPCAMEMDEDPPDERRCPLVAGALRIAALVQLSGLEARPPHRIIAGLEG